MKGNRHDFKFNLPDSEGLTKTCCAFANSLGGFVVVGVKDRGGRFLVVGIQPDGEIAKKFADKLDATPAIEFSPPRMVNVPGGTKVLYVFHVPTSLRRPHLPRSRDKRIFWKRTPGGCEQMSREEIEEQFLRYEERRDKLKLLFVELLLNRENLTDISRVKDGQYSLMTLETGVLDRLLVDVYSVLQAERRLVRILLTLRNQIQIINANAKIFFTKMASPRTDGEQVAAEYQTFMRSKEKLLVPLMTEALQILQNRFGLRDPLAEEEQPGT